MSSVSRNEKFLSETELPKEVKVFERLFPARYNRGFRKGYDSLGPQEKLGVYEAIQNLAKRGIGPQLYSKSFPRKKNPLIPKGSIISKAKRSKSIRFAWNLIDGEVVFYFVGAHPEIWDSEA